ncbi:MAG TPA: TraR/DksA family transcriptional regulator [Burkholderiales bacterium]|nr:TraR/DksA family transcriptional regulator [Burkholderiales bacterium]
MEATEGLSKEQLARFGRLLAERKVRLQGEVRAVLEREGASERYDQLVSPAGDAGDASVAVNIRDIANAEVDRDIRELRDIAAAEERMAHGGYGYCIECGVFIGVPRLEAYPTAKRCIEHQRLREKTRASSPHSTL